MPKYLLMKSLILFLLLFSTYASAAQQREVFHIDSLPTEGVLLNKYWKYRTGDEPHWAKTDFDDSEWTPIDPMKEIVSLPEIFNTQIRWLRLNFEVRNKLPKPLGIAVNQAGASQIYLNGQLIHQFGHFDTDSSKVKAYDPLHYPIYLPVDTVGQYTLAVRYVLQPNIRYTNTFALTKNRFFYATIVPLTLTMNAQRQFNLYRVGLDIFLIGNSFVLLILHVSFYFFQRANKTQLVLAAYFLSIVFTRLFKIIGQNQFSVENRYYNLNMANLCLAFAIMCLINVLYRMAKVRLDIYFYLMTAFLGFYVLVASFNYGFPWTSILLLTILFISILFLARLIKIGLQKRIKGFLALGIAIVLSNIGLVCLVVALLFLNYGISPTGHNAMKYGISPYMIDLIVTFSAVTIPVGLSLFIGIQGNETNKVLNKQLAENEELKNKAIEQEKERQQILEIQNEMLENQVTERTAELNHSLATLKATQNQLIQSEKLASLGELTAGISHEIQNPLNFVNNFSELSIDLVKDIKEELEQPSIDKEYIDELFGDLASNQEKINHHSKRASSIIKGMLEHSRASTGIKELTDLNKLIDEYLRLSYHGLRAKDKSFNADFSTDFDEKLPKISIISQDIGRVVLNLINNAFYAVNEKRKKYGLEDYKPTISVSTKQIDNQVVVKIKDNGTGMPDSVKTKIFQPFFTTKPAGEGTGLGLSLSYDIVTKGHGGTLEVSSTERLGTEFIIKLPC